MKLHVNTRFDLGDVVYAADHYYDYYASRKPYVINDIVVNINNRDVRVMYGVERNDVADRFPEEWLFNTYEECKRWCEEQNKEG